MTAAYGIGGSEVHPVADLEPEDLGEVEADPTIAGDREHRVIKRTGSRGDRLGTRSGRAQAVNNRGVNPLATIGFWTIFVGISGRLPFAHAH